jgi:hypothetical protein
VGREKEGERREERRERESRRRGDRGEEGKEIEERRELRWWTDTSWKCYQKKTNRVRREVKRKRGK